MARPETLFFANFTRFFFGLALSPALPFFRRQAGGTGLLLPYNVCGVAIGKSGRIVFTESLRVMRLKPRLWLYRPGAEEAPALTGTGSLMDFTRWSQGDGVVMSAGARVGYRGGRLLRFGGGLPVGRRTADLRPVTDPAWSPEGNRWSLSGDGLSSLRSFPEKVGKSAS